MDGSPRMGVPVSETGRPSTPPPGATASGDDAAFERAYDEHRVFVFWLVSRILGDDADAEDCCQEVWMKVRKALPGFEGRSRLRSWISTIATNHARDMLRGRARTRKTLEAALEVQRYEALRAEQQAEDELRHGTVVEAVRSLDALPRQVVEMKLDQPELTLDQIGDQLELPRHKVKYAWRKALDILKQRLTEWNLDSHLAAAVLWLPTVLDFLEGPHV